MFHKIHKIILKIFGHLCFQWICIDALTDLERRAQDTFDSWEIETGYWIKIMILVYLTFCKTERCIFAKKKNCQRKTNQSMFPFVNTKMPNNE